MADLGSIFVKFGGETSGFTRGNKEVQNGIRQTGDHTSKLSGLMKTLGGAMIAAFSVRAVINFGKESVTAFDESAKAGAKLLSALQGNEAATKRLISQSASMQSESLFDDETIQNAQMFLATMKLTESQITRITPVIMDFATKMGTDLQGAASIVSKTIGSSVNALARYGIEVTGAAGSSERLESVMTGLTKQVGGLSKAAADAGSSGLVQLKNTINDIKELIGKGIWESSGFSKFIANLKTSLELRTGKTQEIAASDIITEGRAIMARAASVEEGKKALEDYIKVKKEEQKINAAKVDPSLMGTAKRAWMIDGREYEKNLANIAATTDAVKELNKLYKDPAAIEKLRAESGAQVKVNENLAYYLELKKSTEEHQALPTTTVKEAQADARLIAGYDKKIKAITEYGKALTNEEQLKLRIDALNVSYDNTEDRAKKAAIQDIIDKLQKDLDLEKQIRAENITTVTPIRGTNFPGLVSNKTQEQIAADKLQVERNLPLKPLVKSTVDPAILEQAKALNDAKIAAGDTKKAYIDLNQVIGGASVNAFDSLTQSLADLGTGQITVQTFFYKMLITVADFMKAFGAALVSAALASEAFQKSLISNPYVALGAGIALIGAAAVVRSIGTKNLKGYTDGGVFRSPTVGIFGEYPGARSNPEVAGKLSELKQVFGGGSINGKLYIEGRDLVYVFGQELNRQARM